MAESSSYNELLDLSVPAAVWRLALPAIGAMFVRYTNVVVDQFWVGRLQHAQTGLAAVGASNFLIWSTFALAALFSTGLQAMVARAVGAGDVKAQAKAIRHGMFLATTLGFVVAAVGIVAHPYVFAWQQLPPDVAKVASQFLTVLLAAMPVMYVSMGMITIYTAEGDTKTPLRVLLIGLVVNFVLDPPFILGWGPIPAMGAAGSALATVLVVVVQTIVLGSMHRRKMAERVRAEFEPRHLLTFLRLGLPVAAAGVLFSGIYVLLVRILAPFGAAPVAALALGHTIEGFSHFACMGFGTSAATLVGQNLGAKRPDRAQHSALVATGMLCLMLAPVALIYGLRAPHLLSFFMREPDLAVLAAGTGYLHVAATVQLFSACKQVLQMAMVGAGDTFAPAVSLTCTLSRIPLAWMLARHYHLGPEGVWLSIGISVVLEAFAMVGLFYSGRWKHRRV